MASTLRSPDLAQHGAIGLVLTDRQIDGHQLKGRYGEKKRNEMLRLVRKGVIKHLDKAIRSGKFGSDAEIALKQRVGKRSKKVMPTKEQIVSEMLKELGLEL